MAQKKGIEVINLFESDSNSVISPVGGLTDGSNSVITQVCHIKKQKQAENISKIGYIAAKETLYSQF